MNKELEQSQANLERYKQERATWENRVHLLKPSSLDLDMLEERARVMLNFTRENEIVILDRY